MKFQTVLNTIKSNLYWRFFYPRITMRQNEWYVICPAGTGDTYFICSLAKELMAQKGGAAVNLIVKNSHKDIPKWFSGIKKVYFFDGRYAVHLMGYGDLRPGRLFLGHPSAVHGLEKEIGKSCTLLGSYERLLGLSGEVALETPCVGSEQVVAAKRRFESKALPVGRTVLLCPEANSIATLDPQFWQLLVKKLKNEGWTVCTNVLKEGEEIPGTLPFSFPLSEAIPMVELAGWVIALRSGFCDLISSAKTRLSIIYPDRIWQSGRFLEGASLIKMGLSRSAEEFLLDESGDYEDVFRKILSPGNGSIR